LLAKRLLFIDLCESTKKGAGPQGGWVVEKETFVLKRGVVVGKAVLTHLIGLESARHPAVAEVTKNARVRSFSPGLKPGF